MKKIFISLIVLLTFCTVSYAETPPTIYINGKQLYCDSSPIVIEGRTLVPVRAIFEALGQEVKWNDSDQSITCGDIWLQINNNKAIFWDKIITLDVAPKIISNKTYVPLRFVGESLGKDVVWNGDLNRIDINDVLKQNINQQQNISTEKGNLKGTITWQYNDFIGTKPDVGAVIFLIPSNFNPNSITDEDLKQFYGNFIAPKNSGIFSTKTNGYGYYEISNVPQGEYIIFIMSRMASRNNENQIDQNTINLLKPVIKNWDFFKLIFLDTNKFKCDRITINRGLDLDYSHDFGYSYL